ncbi:MAG: hypothetical protein ABIJ45_03465 [Candidatus Zixiibacteriota bacterium]
MPNKIIFGPILLLLLGWFSQGFAQNVTETNPLSFGNVFVGIPKVVSKYTPGTAAEYYIQGTAGAEVTIDITLPTYMSAGGQNMQIIFREDDCSMDSSASYDQTNPGYDDIDPWHQITYRLGSDGLRIWLGGTVVPGLRQSEGSYSASIVITVAYTGG